MYLSARKNSWTRLGDAKTAWKSFSGINLERLPLMESVWSKEIGILKDHCRLLGIKKNVIIVKTDSAAVSNELALRSRQIIKSLNKYFIRPWIKSIRVNSDF
ncbi:MAG: DUF721 domain-containing protein [Elusimicrobia bacterium]|nr:DUF721 domain-containing protein [Elusimicrobiota bacterium]